MHLFMCVMKKMFQVLFDEIPKEDFETIEKILNEFKRINIKLVDKNYKEQKLTFLQQIEKSRIQRPEWLEIFKNWKNFVGIVTNNTKNETYYLWEKFVTLMNIVQSENPNGK